MDEKARLGLRLLGVFLFWSWCCCASSMGRVGERGLFLGAGSGELPPRNGEGNRPPSSCMGTPEVVFARCAKGPPKNTDRGHDDEQLACFSRRFCSFLSQPPAAALNLAGKFVAIFFFCAFHCRMQAHATTSALLSKHRGFPALGTVVLARTIRIDNSQGVQYKHRFCRGKILMGELKTRTKMTGPHASGPAVLSFVLQYYQACSAWHCVETSPAHVACGLSSHCCRS